MCHVINTPQATQRNYHKFTEPQYIPEKYNKFPEPYYTPEKYHKILEPYYVISLKIQLHDKQLSFNAARTDKLTLLKTLSANIRGHKR